MPTRGLLVLLAAALAAIGKANPDAKRLYEDLLQRNRYDRVIRPVSNISDKLTVRLGLRLTQLIDVVSTWCFLSCARTNIALLF